MKTARPNAVREISNRHSQPRREADMPRPHREMCVSPADKLPPEVDDRVHAAPAHETKLHCSNPTVSVVASGPAVGAAALYSIARLRQHDRKTLRRGHEEFRGLFLEFFSA